jgi:hypothetical protein
MGVIELHRVGMPCDVAVETGTCLGESTEKLAREYGLVHTVELSEPLYHRAVRRFELLPHVHCHHGDSPEVLSRIVPELDGTVLFYLDAHYSGDAATEWLLFRGYGVDTARSKVPLLEELDVIVRLCRGPCVVYIDDMDKFDAEGQGLRDQGFVGEDWTHLTVSALHDAVAPRLNRTLTFGDQLVFHLAALDEAPFS